MDDGRRPGSLPGPAASPRDQVAGPPDPPRIRSPGRLRQIAMIIVFDLGGPLLAYALLRSAGISTVGALVVSGVLPALGIALGAVLDRRLDVIGVIVLAGIVVGTILGLTTHNARLYLLEGSVPSAVFALGCLFSLRLRQPLIYRLAVEILGPDTPKGRDVTAAWRYPGVRRAFRVITMVWGVAYLVEAAVRSVIVATEPTGIALVSSKLLPYAFAISLSAWTLVYGEREKKKAEHLAAANAAAGSSAAAKGSSAATKGSSAATKGPGASDVAASAGTEASPASPGH